jgi:mannose-6-phosphate isomerase-like protein (cupin superfamily)
LPPYRLDFDPENRVYKGVRRTTSIHILKAQGASAMSSQQTFFGSLENYRKGGVETIDDNPKNYAFSNIFEVASTSKPYEKVAVGKNLKYVIEALRAEGTSPWFAAAHDEAALVMDGELEVHYVKPEQPVVAAGKEGTVKLAGEPTGKKMGWVKVRRGHMALLPAGAAYQFRNAGKPGVLLVQTILGENTIEKWTEICQTS